MEFLTTKVIRFVSQGRQPTAGKMKETGNHDKEVIWKTSTNLAGKIPTLIASTESAGAASRKPSQERVPEKRG